jgi:DNA-binding SARP family transcriptional activator/Tfp pilus assembly protein PilF
MFVLELLGTLSLSSDTGPVPVAAQQKRPLGLLAILALAGSQGISRDRIEAYLWPESSGVLARHSLGQTVYAIRNALESEFIVSAGRELRLNPELVRSDLWEFEKAIRASQWRAAVDYYKGPLLDGFHSGDSRELESWVDTHRTRLRVDYENAIEFLASQSAGAGDHSQSVSWWRRLVTSDPLSPVVTKKLMLALAAAGDLPSAVKHARRYQELVRQELEMEPDSEIERLATTFSHPASSEAQPTVSPLRAARVGQYPRSAGPPQVPSEVGATETRVHHVSHGELPRMMRSPIAAVLTFSILIACLIGAVLVDRAEMRDPRSGLRANKAGRTSRIAVPAASDAYLRGLNAWNEGSKGGVDTAVVYFRRATELDPDYAEAYAGLAIAYSGLGYYGYRPSEAMLPKSKAAALRSIQLESTLPSAHAALAFELLGERDFAGAELESRQAIALDPEYAIAHQGYAIILMILGRKREALAESRRAATLDPFSRIIQGTYGSFLNSSGEHLAALRQLEKAFGEEPDSEWVARNPWPSDNMARVYADNGQYARAVRTTEGALKIVPRHPRVLYSLALIYDAMGRRDMARQAFARADTSSELYAAYRGMVYAEEGLPDSAFLWFDRVEKWGIQPMQSLQSDWHLEPLRRDTRYRELLRRIGLPTQESAPEP